MFNHVFIGGTFDHFHDGHKALLQKAFEEGNLVTIGITSDDFIKQYKDNKIVQSFIDRKEALTGWLTTSGKTNFHIISIDDPYEPASSESFDALIVTSQNKKTGEEINEKRISRNLPPVTLVEVPLVTAFDGNPISASRIRGEVIDAHGNLILPASLRAELKKPLGRVIPDVTDWSPTENIQCIAVGDMTTDILLQKGIRPILSIIDLYVQRAPYKSFEDLRFPEMIVKKTVVSGPGFISKEAIEILQSWKEQHFVEMVMVVTGEDDLLVLPAILAAPINSFLYYGQPNQGLVEVQITEAVKAKIRSYLGLFTTE